MCLRVGTMKFSTLPPLVLHLEQLCWTVTSLMLLCLKPNTTTISKLLHSQVSSVLDLPIRSSVFAPAPAPALISSNNSLIMAILPLDLLQVVQLSKHIWLFQLLLSFNSNLMAAARVWSPSRQMQLSPKVCLSSKIMLWPSITSMMIWLLLPKTVAKLNLLSLKIKNFETLSFAIVKYTGDENSMN